MTCRERYATVWSVTIKVNVAQSAQGRKRRIYTMTDTHDGGPAFPACNEANINATMGMTLRDWFAGQASEPPESWISMQRGIDRNRNPYNEPHKPAPRDDFQLTAEWKFAHADAMLAARSEAK